jgi:predicted lipopolysaccharide heptosyltransferase III
MPIDNIQNILVTRLRFMGDVILTTPLLHALRREFPSARITYIAEYPYISLLENHPAVDTLIGIERKKITGSLRAFARLVSSRYDLAIDLFGNPRSALLTFLCGAKIRIGGDFRGRRRLYTHLVNNDNRTLNAIEFHLSYLEPLGIHFPAADPGITITETEKKQARDYLLRRGFHLDEKIIGIHPGATWPAKRWFPNRFAVLANRLMSQNKTQILFTMGNGEQDIMAAVIKSCTFSVIEPKILPLRQLAAVLSQLDVYISNDCGPMHLAPAVGTPTIGIFGPGEPDIWFPYDISKGHRFIHHDIPCSRCHKDRCDDMACMQAIGVDEVYDAVKRTIQIRKQE